MRVSIRIYVFLTETPIIMDIQMRECLNYESFKEM